MNNRRIETRFNVKYASRNPFVILMNKLLFMKIAYLANICKAKNVLDVGCGEGVVTRYLVDSCPGIKTVVGVDLGLDRLKIAEGMNYTIKYFQGSIYNLPFIDDSFDLVLSTEVLEHLEDPSKAISELRRVSKEYIIISVPYDFFFRLANILRLKYISNLGNPPRHIQHWNKRSFKHFISQGLDIFKISIPLLWLIFLCKVKKVR